MHRALITLVGLALASSASAQITIKTTNKLPLARTAQTIEVSDKNLADLNARDLSFVHIKDSFGKEVLAQAVDLDFDEFHKPDMVIFQADFGPTESKTFTASVGEKQTFTVDQYKAHGRFNRERLDDFCWENDRIAHRMYGKALETWKGEPLTSSTIDIWSKKTPKMVTDLWYLADDYHVDHGEGADYYSAGASRGDGGNGIWANGQLFVSKNFVASRVLTNGPIRVTFEVDYDAFDAGGVQVAETKRISLDAGSNLDHYISMYKPASSTPLVSGIGLKKVNGETGKEFNAERGTLIKWERVEKNAGMQGLAIVADTKISLQAQEDRTNWLVLSKADASNTVAYWAGFCWDKGGQFTTLDQWKKYVDEFAQAAASPIEVVVGK